MTYNYLTVIFVYNLFITQHSEALIFSNLLKWAIYVFTILKNPYYVVWNTKHITNSYFSYIFSILKIKHTPLVAWQKRNLISATFLKPTAWTLKIKKPFKKGLWKAINKNYEKWFLFHLVQPCFLQSSNFYNFPTYCHTF